LLATLLPESLPEYTFVQVPVEDSAATAAVRDLNRSFWLLLFFLASFLAAFDGSIFRRVMM
tara:strand:- start:532 stop:714 length:183 start_codon:yes stop_codon:yes gene_type:complete